MKKTEDVDEMNENWLETLWNEEVRCAVLDLAKKMKKAARDDMVWTRHEKR